MTLLTVGTLVGKVIGIGTCLYVVFLALYILRETFIKKRRIQDLFPRIYAKYRKEYTFTWPALPKLCSKKPVTLLPIEELLLQRLQGTEIANLVDELAVFEKEHRVMITTNTEAQPHGVLMSVLIVKNKKKRTERDLRCTYSQSRGTWSLLHTKESKF